MSQMFFTTNASIPLRKSEEILRRLVYSIKDDHINADEFTLNRWKKTIEDLILHRKADEKDYEALGLIFFNLRKFDSFRSIMNEGIQKFGSIHLLGALTIGEISISEINQELEVEKHIKNYFAYQENSKGNKTVSFTFQRFAHSFFYDRKTVEFKNPVTYEFEFFNIENYNCNIGPYSFHRPLLFLETTKLDQGIYLIQEICKKITEGDFTGEFKSFAEQTIPDHFLNHIIELATPKEFIGV